MKKVLLGLLALSAVSFATISINGNTATVPVTVSATIATDSTPTIMILEDITGKLKTTDVSINHGTLSKGKDNYDSIAESTFYVAHGIHNGTTGTPTVINGKTVTVKNTLNQGSLELKKGTDILNSTLTINGGTTDAVISNFVQDKFAEIKVSNKILGTAITNDTVEGAYSGNTNLTITIDVTSTTL